MTREVKPPTVICDTREARPWIPWIWRDARRVLLPVVRRALVAGDYTIEGYEQEIAIERKSLADWIGTMFGASTDALGERATSWERFRRELARVKEGVARTPDDPPVPPLRSFCVVVEASRTDVERHDYRSGVLPQSVLGRSDSVWADYGIPVYWLDDRDRAERFAMWTMVRWWEGRERMKGATDADIRKAFALAERSAAPPPQEPATGAPRGFDPGEGCPRARKAEAKRVHERAGGAR